jgi:putative ABC transport system substrate-binding protein
MRRRDFIVVLGAVTFRSSARAQQPGTQIVGYLTSGSLNPASSAWAAFLQAMREVGYIEGQNVSFEIQSAEYQYDRLPALAKSLVDRHVSVIVAQDVPAAHAAKGATSTIPIVFISGIDPVKDGLVASLNTPAQTSRACPCSAPDSAQSGLSAARYLQSATGDSWFPQAA